MPNPMSLATFSYSQAWLVVRDSEVSAISPWTTPPSDQGMPYLSIYLYIYIHLSIYVSVYACMYVCMHVRMYVRTYIWSMVLNL